MLEYSPLSFSPLQGSLKVLNLSDNGELYKTNPNILQGTCNIFSALEVLNLSNTGLKTIHDSVVIAFPKLKVLDIGGEKNVYTSVPNDLIKKLWKKTTTLQRVYTHGVKSLVNNCTNSYLIHWLGLDSVHKPNGRDVFCKTPSGETAYPVLGGVSVDKIAPNSSCPIENHSENSATIVTSSCFIFAVIHSVYVFFVF